MIVVDTNIILYLLLPNEKYNQLAFNLYEKDKNWVAPSLWRYEFLSILTLYQRKTIIKPNISKILFKKALEVVESRDLINVDHVFNAIENSTLSAYDCNFVGLSKETGLPLITEDKKILTQFSTIAVSMEKYLHNN